MKKLMHCFVIVVAIYQLSWGYVEERVVKGTAVKMVHMPLDSVRVIVGLARGKVGATETLDGIAKRYGAIAAINGCFFDAYASSPIKPPYHTIITQGQLVHIGNVGTLLGFDQQGNYRMERVQIEINGEVNNEQKWWLRDWFAYFVNHTPNMRNASILFNRYWCQTVTPNAGIQVVIENGKVTNIGRGSKSIPENGFVLLLLGSEEAMAERFQIGSTVQFKIDFTGGDPNFWSSVQEAIGCGPRLVANGEIVVNPISEGFSHPKILYMSMARSAVGITRSREIMFVTCRGATIKKMAEIMKALGAYDAMNLDGGASSGLWFRGRYLTTPGRLISNALLLVKK
jgi:hypothetical protein